MVDLTDLVHIIWVAFEGTQIIVDWGRDGMGLARGEFQSQCNYCYFYGFLRALYFVDRISDVSIWVGKIVAVSTTWVHFY